MDNNFLFLLKFILKVIFIGISVGVVRGVLGFLNERTGKTFFGTMCVSFITTGLILFLLVISRRW